MAGQFELGEEVRYLSLHNNEDADQNKLLNVYCQLLVELFLRDISYPVPEIVVTADYQPTRLCEDPHFVDWSMLIAYFSKFKNGSLIWILLYPLVDFSRNNTENFLDRNN